MEISLIFHLLNYLDRVSLHFNYRSCFDLISSSEFCLSVYLDKSVVNHGISMAAVIYPVKDLQELIEVDIFFGEFEYLHGVKVGIC